MTTAATKNGVWLKAIATLAVAAIVAGVTLAWTLNGRVTTNESSLGELTRRLERMEDKQDQILKAVHLRAPP